MKSSASVPLSLLYCTGGIGAASRFFPAVVGSVLVPLLRICVCASRFQCGVSCVGSLRWEHEMISQLWVGG
jgi:hypothetical protein